MTKFLATSFACFVLAFSSYFAVKSTAYEVSSSRAKSIRGGFDGYGACTVYEVTSFCNTCITDPEGGSVNCSTSDAYVECFSASTSACTECMVDGDGQCAGDYSQYVDDHCSLIQSTGPTCKRKYSFGYKDVYYPGTCPGSCFPTPGGPPADG